MKDIIAELTDKDDNTAYARTKELAAASELSDAYYPCLDIFASLLSHEKSYIRTRAFILCCCQAKWDNEGKLNRLLPSMLPLLDDPKPTVVRQCLNAVKEIMVFRPELGTKIMQTIDRIDLSKYKESMHSLIEKEISKVREMAESPSQKNRK